MLTFHETPDLIADIKHDKEIVGRIHYKSQEDINNVHQLQCKHCLREFGRKDRLNEHLRICRVRLSNEREQQHKQAFFTELQVPSGRSENFELAFPLAKGERLVMFICGRNGCGKSTFIQKILKNYTQVYKKRKIILFSLQDFDDKLDPIFKNIQRVDLGPDFAEHPYTLDELRNSICIFDDVDSIRDKKLKEAVFKLKDDIMKQGRSPFWR